MVNDIQVRLVLRKIPLPLIRWFLPTMNVLIVTQEVQAKKEVVVIILPTNPYLGWYAAHQQMAFNCVERQCY